MRTHRQNLTAGLLAAALLAVVLASCVMPLVPKRQPTYKDGLYTGTGKGMMGPMTVEVTVENGAISNIVLKEHSETEGVYEKAETWVIAEILEDQTAEVDAVAGATYASNGIMQATADALSKAVEK